MQVAGADGCRNGWVVVHGEVPDGPLKADFIDKFPAVFDAAPDAEVIAVDIPIGLANSGLRGADVEARRLLAEYGSRVFPAPLRPLLEFMASNQTFGAADYPTVNHWSKDHRERGLQRQQFFICEKILQVDRFVITERGRRVYEVHPEVSFRAMDNGTPVALQKSKLEGRTARRTLLEREVGPSVTVLTRPRTSVGWDDLYDAAAAWWTAARVATGDAQHIPDTPERDPVLDRDIAIWY